MHRILLAAATALTIASVPAFAQSTDCPQGTTNTAPEGSPVTCEADASSAEPAPADPAGEQAGDTPLDSTETGEGVKDAVTDEGTK